MKVKKISKLKNLEYEKSVKSQAVNRETLVEE